NLTYIDEKFDFSKPVLSINSSSSKRNYSTRLISIPSKLIDLNFNINLSENKILTVNNQVNNKNETTKNTNVSPRSIN
mgnify:CR=1